jgi:hypothetical protein
VKQRAQSNQSFTVFSEPQFPVNANARKYLKPTEYSSTDTDILYLQLTSQHLVVFCDEIIVAFSNIL